MGKWHFLKTTLINHAKNLIHNFCHACKYRLNITAII